jgi:hypothetical protein
MHRYVYRELEAHQTALLGTVDRSEQIDALHRRVDGVLRLEPAQQAVPSWQGAELDALVARLQSLLTCGGRAFGDGMMGCSSASARSTQRPSRARST